MLAGSLARRAQDALARQVVAVADDEVRMGVMGIRSRLVDGRKPCRPTIGERFGELMDELAPLCGVQLARQGEHQLVDDAGVLAVAPLLRIEPSPRAVAVGRHPRRHDDRRGRLAGDVTDMRSGRTRRMGRAADTAEV